MHHVCYNFTGAVVDGSEAYSEITNFLFSKKNSLFIMGCNMSARVDYNLFDEDHSRERETYCNKSQPAERTSCPSSSCIQFEFPRGVSDIHTLIKSPYNLRDERSSSCLYAFIVEEEYFHLHGKSDLENIRNDTGFPVLLEFAVGNQTCLEAGNRSLCKRNSNCVDSPHSTHFSSSYSCRCNHGFQGNPYLSNGCKDMDECMMKKHNCAWYKRCHNVAGSFHCITSEIFVISITASITGVGVLFIGFYCLVRKLRKHKQTKRKERNFEQNGGLMLLERLLAEEGTESLIKIYTEEDIKKATENYQDKRILGEGGQGVVYRGVLSDGTEVAVKKARCLDPNQTYQFVNEIVVLSRIHNPHVVRLLGCCMETETPLLVYELVSGGTLSENLHASSLAWEDRLRIASEVAGTLAHLHSSTPVPILHRDVKPANILLDDNLRSKVSDFGSSRVMPADKEQLTTLVQGTIGYLDPEYLHTSTLSDKSDVYSFGVLLMELVSGQKAVCFDRPQDQKPLVTHFESALKDDIISQVIDKRVANAENHREICETALLAIRCTRVKGDDRPKMTQVAQELEGLRSSRSHGSGPSVSRFEIEESN